MVLVATMDRRRTHDFLSSNDRETRDRRLIVKVRIAAKPMCRKIAIWLGIRRMHQEGRTLPVVEDEVDIDITQ
jgi:hypothetical protein